MATYSLNNDGSRTRTEGARVLVKDHGIPLGVYAVDCEEAFGNFAAFRFRVKGVRYGAIPSSFRDEATGLPVCEIEGAAVYGRTPKVSRFVLAATMAQLGADMHSGGGSRGYRTLNRGMLALKRYGYRGDFEPYVNRLLYAKLAAKYGDASMAGEAWRKRYAPFAERVRQSL